MNKLSKLLALILALSLVLGMSAAVWATDNTGLTVSVNSQYEDRVYKAYKIFAGEIEDNTDADDFGNGNTRKLSNIEWADGIDGAAMITALNGIDAVKTANGDSEIAAGTSASDVAEILSKITDKDALIAISKVFYDKKGAAAGQSVKDATYSGTGFKYDITNLDAGYYIIVDETGPVLEEAQSAILLNVVGNTSVTEKIALPTIAKAVWDESGDKDKNTTEENYGDTADHNINETFTFRLTATLPAAADYDAYSAYKLIFTDTPSKGITYESIESVVVSGKTSADEAVNETIQAYTESVPNGYKLTNNLTDDKGDGTSTLLIEITDLKQTVPTLDLTKGATITVIYKAHLNENAYVTPVGGTTTTNANKVKLTYSDNPVVPTSTADTNEKIVYVFTYEVDNTKWAGPGEKVDDPASVVISGEETLATTTKTEWADDTNHKYYKKSGSDWLVMNALAGAGFTLYSDSAKTTAIKLIDNGDGTYTVADQAATSGTVEEMVSAATTGIFNIKGLDAGTYYLAETSTPDGYNTAEDVTITIGAVHELEGTSPKVALSLTNADNDIVDNSGIVLPSTGGIGTTIFYVVGAILVIGAGILLVSKKKVGKGE